MRVLKRLQWLDLSPDSPILATPEFQQFLQACFAPLRNSDGSWKRSHATRHGELDNRLAAILGKRLDRPRVFMDVGMANGISTLETIRCLERAGLGVQTIATDRNLVAYVVRLHKNLDVLVEPNGHILMIEWNGWRLSPACGLWDYLTGRGLVKWGLTMWAKRRLARLSLPLEPRSGGTAEDPGAVEGPFLMVTPELKGRSDVVVRIEDILEPLAPDLTGVADMVRIVNVLRPDRFPPAQLRQIAVNLRQRCRDGGLLVVGRNRMQRGVRSRWAVSIFQAEPGGNLQLVERLGTGSEVEAYFLPPGGVASSRLPPAQSMLLASDARRKLLTISRSGE